VTFHAIELDDFDSSYLRIAIVRVGPPVRVRIGPVSICTNPSRPWSPGIVPVTRAPGICTRPAWITLRSWAAAVSSGRARARACTGSSTAPATASAAAPTPTSTAATALGERGGTQGERGYQYNGKQSCSRHGELH